MQSIYERRNAMRKREIIALDNMRIQGKKPTEIANALGISVNTVKSHIRRHPDIPELCAASTAANP